MVSYGFGKVGEGGTKELVGVGEESDRVGLALSKWQVELKLIKKNEAHVFLLQHSKLNIALLVIKNKVI